MSTAQTKPFEMGPVQKACIAALRSGQYNQGFGKCVIPSEYGDKCYCVLGVFAQVSQIECKSDYTLDNFENLGLVSRYGDAKDYRNTKLNSIVGMNDGDQLSFNEIADIIEQNSDQYFTHPV